MKYYTYYKLTFHFVSAEMFFSFILQFRALRRSLFASKMRLQPALWSYKRLFLVTSWIFSHSSLPALDSQEDNWTPGTLCILLPCAGTVNWPKGTSRLFHISSPEPGLSSGQKSVGPEASRGTNILSLSMCVKVQPGVTFHTAPSCCHTPRRATRTGPKWGRSWGHLRAEPRGCPPPPHSSYK